MTYLTYLLYNVQKTMLATVTNHRGPQFLCRHACPRQKARPIFIAECINPLKLQKTVKIQISILYKYWQITAMISHIECLSVFKIITMEKYWTIRTLTRWLQAKRICKVQFSAAEYLPRVAHKVTFQLIGYSPGTFCVIYDVLYQIQLRHTRAGAWAVTSLGPSLQQ